MSRKLSAKLPQGWPTSVPDYDWPADCAMARQGIAQLVLAGIFHFCYAIGMLLSVLRRSRPRALLIRTDGIGDAVLFEPAMETLARSLSPHEIHLWAPRATCELMRACPVIRRRCVIPRGFKEGNLLVLRSPIWRARLGFMMGFGRFDMAIYPADSPEPLGNWLLTSARAPIRWLNSGDTINQFDWQRAKTHERATRILDNRPGHAHELKRNAYISSQWGGALELREPKLYLTAKSIALADRELAGWRHVERQARADGIAAIIPTGSQSLNRYPAYRWIEVLRQLWAEHRALPALLGGPADEHFVRAIQEQLGEVPFVRPRKPLDILTTAALLGRVDAVISVDTGLAHAVVAQKVPSVILRIGGDPGRFFPWPDASQCEVLFKPMPCEGCHNRCHLPEAQCITDVTPAEIVAAYGRLSVIRSPVEISAPAARWMKVAG